MEVTERIAQLLEEKYAGDEAFADCFTVEIELKPAQRLYVFLDSDSGMTFEKCRRISRFLEEHLDAQGWLGDHYVLEVSSPGIGRPLKFPRQYSKNLGRTLALTLRDGSKTEGLLKAADDAGIVLETESTVKEGNKKKHLVIETAIPYDQIEKAVVQIAF